MITLARIAVYPFKSLDPVAVDEAAVLSSGALEHDRRFALCDETGAFINGKRDARIHGIRGTLDLLSGVVRVKAGDVAQDRLFHIEQDRAALEVWFSDYFGRRLHVVENRVSGLPDDSEYPGPTVIGTATLETVAAWFEGITLDEARLRFRANLEICGVEPFWEDRLVARVGDVVRFSIGAVQFEGMNPCARCVVPSRSAATGDANATFQRRFVELRRASFPSWAEPERFDHFYRLAVNTRPVPATVPGRLRVGDEVRILETRPF